MSDWSYVVIDRQAVRGNAVSRALSALGYAFPVSGVEEIGDRLPEQCCIVVSDEDGLFADVMSFLRSAASFCPVIAYATAPEVDRVVDALQAGAMSYFSWPCSDEKLHQVIRSVQGSARQALVERHAYYLADHRLRQLTKRESEVLRGISEGCSNKELARTLGISPRTVEVHRSNLFNKLEVRNAAEAVRLVAAKMPDLSRRKSSVH